jgi:hypothetical protein
MAMSDVDEPVTPCCPRCQGPMTLARTSPKSGATAARRFTVADCGDLHWCASAWGDSGRVGRASYVRATALAALDDGAHRHGAMACRRCRNIRACLDDIRLRLTATRYRPLCSRPLYHGRILVHGINVFRQSGRDGCALIV